MIFDCVLIYLEDGFTEIKETSSSKVKRISVKYGDDFLDWFKEYTITDWEDFQDIYIEFLKSAGYNERSYSQKRFSYALKFACASYDFNRETIKDPVTKKLKVKWNNNLIHDKQPLILKENETWF